LNRIGFTNKVKVLLEFVLRLSRNFHRHLFREQLYGYVIELWDPFQVSEF